MASKTVFSSWMPVIEASEATGIPLKKIVELVEQNRVAMRQDSLAKLPEVYIPDLWAYQNEEIDEEDIQPRKSLMENKRFDEITLEEKIREYAAERAFLIEKEADIMFQLEHKSLDDFHNDDQEFSGWRKKATRALMATRANLTRVNAFLEDAQNNPNVIISMQYRIIELQQQLLDCR